MTVNQVDQSAAKPYFNAFQNVGDAISQLDELIGQQAAMLNLIQPCSPGKIGVKFIKPRGGAEVEPTFVCWKGTPAGRSKNNIIHYDILKPAHITRSIKRHDCGPFKGAEEDVRLLIVEIKQLMERRKILTVILGRFSQAASMSLRAANRTISRINRAWEDQLLEIYVRYTDRMHVWKARKMGGMAPGAS